MTVRWPVITIVAMLVCLLAVATSAAADRGWVLWSLLTQKDPGLLQPSWVPLHPVVDSEAKCRADRTRMEKLDSEIRVAGPRMMTFVCLPADVDPRGPTWK